MFILAMVFIAVLFAVLLQWQATDNRRHVAARAQEALARAALEAREAVVRGWCADADAAQAKAAAYALAVAAFHERRQ